jgi:arabinofuranan 3-O-arabinosyltransferase
MRPLVARPTPPIVERGEAALMAALTYLPLLVGARGRLNADTKQYLYLNPGDLLHRAQSLWDPQIGGGAVTHQTIGYLWPMGPFYWVFDHLGMPDWATQRLWIGSIQMLAGLGALVLFRTVLPRHGPAQLLAALGYGLSPFVLGHVTGQSALLLPFTALPWMVWCLVRGLDDGTWRWPALFALTVATCGSLNGSSIFFVLVGSVLWIPFGVWILGRATVREGTVLLIRTGVLTLFTQLWWLVAYMVGGRFGLPILSVTETVQATSSTTSAAEVLRGLGYWFMYGRDIRAPWLPGLGTTYETSPLLILVTFSVPVVALALASRLRWSSRAYFTALVTLGTLMATVSFSAPWRSPAGVAFESASRHVDLVLSLRNTQRAGPLVALGLMGLLAAALTALWNLRVRRAAAIGAALLVAIVGSLPGEWGGLIAARFHRKDVPSYWYDAGSTLDEGKGNVLELPGIDFASYRWGHTLDPVSIGLTSRPVIARELVPQGSPVGVSLLNAVDRSLQEGWVESRALAPMARLLGASTILARNDLEYERYRTARPQEVWRALTAPDSGLGPPEEIGTPSVNRPPASNPLLDEDQLRLGETDRALAPVALFPVPGGDRPALGTHGTGAATVVDGNGEGLYAASAAGLLDDPPGALLYGADLATEGTDAAALIGSKARYLITDSNRNQAERWYSLHENVGATEPPGVHVVDQEDVKGRIDLVAGEPDTARTVTRLEGAQRIWASSYGGTSTLLPEDRPSNAFDGDPTTAWRVDTSSTQRPYRLSIELESPVHPNHVNLVQPQARPGTRPVTRATVVLDGTRRFPVVLSPDDAFSDGGVRVALDGKPFTRLDVQLDEFEQPYGSSGIGELEIPGVHVTELVVPPTATTERLGTSIGSQPLAFVLSRLRADPSEPLRADPEDRLRRLLDLPGPVTVSLSGAARLRTSAADDLIDNLVAATGPTARSRQHLAGDLAARASAALDGDRTTAWTTPFVGLDNQWWEATSPTTLTVDTVTLDVVADDHHSLPTEVSVSVDGSKPVMLDLPHLQPGPLGTVRSVPLRLPTARRGKTVRVQVEHARRRTTTDWYSNGQIALPIALAEVQVPGLGRVRPGAAVDTGCRTDLLTVDGAALGVRITGTAAAALHGDALSIATCDGKPLRLASGSHVLETTPGQGTGLDLDRLVLRTAAWDTAPAPSTGPKVVVTHESRGHLQGTVANDGTPFWLVVDQSASDGWKLTTAGSSGMSAAVDGPHPVDGNAVGWLVTPTKAGSLRVDATWTPQKGVTQALMLSLLTGLLCVGLVAWREPRKRRAALPYGPPRLTRGPDIGWRRTLPIAAASAAVAGLCVHP